MRYLIIFTIFLLMDLYVFKGINLVFNNTSPITKKTYKVVFWLVNLFLLFQLLYIIFNFSDYKVNNPRALRFWIGIFVSIFITKLTFIGFHLIDDIYLGIQSIIRYIKPENLSPSAEKISRSKFITQAGLGFAGLILGAYTYGVRVGKYSFHTIKKELYFDRLPLPFHGLRIVHVSDFHLGSFLDDYDEVKKGFDMINDLRPDIILFTGDMVNENATEAEAWIPYIKDLKAKYGKYSIFGNHDYADYGRQPKQARITSVKRLKEIHMEMGFKLLEDEYKELVIDNEKIELVGMHNWGKGFHQVGILENALQNTDDNIFKILLSHDPTLWEEKIENKLDIDLTLSGHTHGMQMGIEIPQFNIKWSPIKWRYKKWAGLYGKENQQIYINRGFGFLGFPGRTGIPPEITLLTLNTKSV